MYVVSMVETSGGWRMNRIEILTNALADAWKSGQCDGLLMRQLLNEYRKAGVDQRTENRIREHAHHWVELERREHVVCLNGPGVLMRCPAPCNWIGWIKAS